MCRPAPDDRHALGAQAYALWNALVNASLEPYPASTAASRTLMSLVRNR